MHEPADLLIAGGGLAGGLTALALATRRPDIRVSLVEAGESIGGNHLWSFFDGDIAAAELPLVEPLIVHAWHGHEVAFPRYRRTLGAGYHTIASERLDRAARATLPPDRLMTGVSIRSLDRSGAVLEDGRHVAARAVIDARGVGPIASLDLGWQKFAGRLLRLAAPHGLQRPMIMDGRVPQIDGYRFVYVLPFGPSEVFVEDTYYADGPGLDEPALDQRIADYAASRGWQVIASTRAESGSLPIAMGGDFRAFWASRGAEVGKIGMAAGLFHPMTGYSLPDAVRTAALIADQRDLSHEALAQRLRRHAADRWEERGYYRLLARLLFRAGRPELRYRVLERFYGLDEGLIMRLYSARLTIRDKLRILCGRPPVPFASAVRVLLAGERR